MDIWASVAFVLMLTAVTISFYEALRHLTNFTKPYLQRYIVRILLMVPIYSINAWIAMVLPVTGSYLDSVREVYESFVIYSFMKYLLNFLHYDTNLQQYIDYKPGPGHIIPLCCFPNCVGGKKFMIRCKHGILQYVVIRPITTVIAFASQQFDFYGEGNFNPFSGYAYPVLLLINNISQLTAMYCLVIFYTGYQQELYPMQPLAKFFSIKLVVFFSFFQYVVITGLMQIQVVDDTLSSLFPELHDKISVGRKLQEFLICVDMLIAAVGHLFAFSYKPFREDDQDTVTLSASFDASSGERRPTSRNSNQSRDGQTCCDAFRDLFDFRDEKSDVREHFSQIFSRTRSIFSLRRPLPSVVGSQMLGDQHLTDAWMSDERVAGAAAAAGTRQNDNATEHDDGLPAASRGSINSLAERSSYHSIE